MTNTTDGSSRPSGFRWLHFSDLHVGVEGQSQLWPRFGTLLTDEIERVVERTSGIDLVIFSGDLAQKGAVTEFDAFDEIIRKIVDKIGTVQTVPQIVTVPGNHDIVRPASLDPSVLALKQFWSTPKLRDGFWEKAGDGYREFLAKVFENFLNWRAKAVETGLHLKPDCVGLLPGDASYKLPTPYGELGIAALNSTWLQLGAGDYLGELHVDVRQLHQITGGDPDGWARGCDASILVTHHPHEWLHQSFPATWDSDINPAGRFDLHLFGHMHEPDVRNTSRGGGPTRRNVQAASLFGLETFGDDSHHRIQGYALHRIMVEGEKRVLTCWPRKLISVADGRMKLAPDSSQDIDELSGSFDIRYTVDKRSPKEGRSATEREPEVVAVSVAPTSAFDLAAIRHSLGAIRAHRKVRRVEQEACLVGLRENRVVWVAADWGMGHEGFLGSIAEHLLVPEINIYRLDVSNYAKRVAFFDELQTRFGVTFQQICDAISDTGESILILDDLDIHSVSGSNVEPDVESLAHALSEFASSTYVVIRARRSPRVAHFPVIELKALDEADVGLYAGESELGGLRYSKPDAASKLFRHTDGIPMRIDAALRDLEIISLDDLPSSNPDFGDTGGVVVPAPAALVATISELRGSDDRGEQRAYNLLLALAALPQGEQLPRLKRFLGPHLFGPLHARALLERSLIDTVTLTTLDAMSPDATTKALVVPRTVRDYIRDTIDEKLSKEVDQKALDLYFGDKWSTGDIANSPTAKRVRQALCDGYEIQNASVLIVRSMRRVIDNQNDFEIDSVKKLARGFIGVLIQGDHFRSAVSLCEDMIHILEDAAGHEVDINFLRYEYARSLRMTSQISEAKANFEALDLDSLSKSNRQQAELGLALCFERQGETEEAAKAARRVIAIDGTSAPALQAKVILAQQLPDETERRKQLRRHLQTAQKKKLDTLSSNILIELAAGAARHGEDAEAFYKQVVQNSRQKGDFYNAARAIVALAETPGSAANLTSAERARLIEAYHYLYNERLSGLFDRCHAALWRVFEQSRDYKNLLNLFRHSSFIWRLNGRDSQEVKYLAMLTKNVHDVLAAGLAQTSRDGAYFLVRVTVVLGQLPPGKDADDS